MPIKKNLIQTPNFIWGELGRSLLPTFKSPERYVRKTSFFNHRKKEKTNLTPNP